MIPTPYRPGIAVLLLLAGGATSLSLLALQTRAWGLVLALLATGLALVALPPGWWSRLAFGLGWVGVVAGAASGRGEGDYVLQSNLRGYGILAAALVVLCVVVATLPPPRRGARHEMRR